MTESLSAAAEIRRYLETGETDPLYAGWPGGWEERGGRAHHDLRKALVAEVLRRSAGRSHPHVSADADELTRNKVEEMVRGLFPRAEQALVLAAIERSVVFVTAANVESVLFDHRFNSSAWTVANLYLAAVRAELLSEDAPRLVGLSEDRTCFVSPEYFVEDDLFADFIVHEVAHIFHNCRRTTVGLPETRSKVRPLEIEYSKRETLAYSCEAHSRIIERAKTRNARIALADCYQPRISDDRVDAAELCGIVQAAALARNGWKLILSRCAAAQQRRSASDHQLS